MTTEEKQLLMKDLCARLPYGVIQVFEDNEYPPCAIIGYDGEDFIDEEGWSHRIGEFKPYLRPISSMTKEEENEFISLNAIPSPCQLPNHTRMSWYSNATMLDWLNARHFDYRGLIEKGLALEAPEGVYKED